MITRFHRSLVLHSGSVSLLALVACSSSSAITETADAGASDAAIAAVEEPNDAGAATTSSGDASVCVPKKLRPATYHSARAAAKACSYADIDTFAGCVNNKNGGPECDAFTYPPPPGSPTAGCVECIYSRFDDAKWGPIVLGEVNVINLAGCYELMAGAACGAAMYAWNVCADNRCAGCSKEALTACVADARTSDCKTKHDTMVAKCPGPGTEPYDACEGTDGHPGPRVIRSFCGGG